MNYKRNHYFSKLLCLFFYILFYFLWGLPVVILSIGMNLKRRLKYSILFGRYIINYSSMNRPTSRGLENKKSSYKLFYFYELYFSSIGVIWDWKSSNIASISVSLFAGSSRQKS